jgi:hypothetical protein
MQAHDRTRDRRTKHWFWIDDRVVDQFAPVMGRYSFGAVALAVYAVLARRADRDGESWPSLGSIAADSGSSERTVQRALRLLELLGLVEIQTCYEQGSQRQTSNFYTLLTPPETPPEIDPDPKEWPEPQRRTLLVRPGNRSGSVAAIRREQSALPGERPSWAGLVPAVAGETPRTSDTLPPAPQTPPRRQADTPPPARLTPLEGNTYEGNTRKEGLPTGKNDERWTFTIVEVGLSNRQVWSAVLEELGRRGDVGRAELETWLRPAGLIGREGETLVVGAPNAVARDRIANRLLPALRAAIAATLGTNVALSIVVDGD